MSTPARDRVAEPLNWRALADFHDLLVRRSIDPDEWVIAARRSKGQGFAQPMNDGAWAGSLAFLYPGAADRIPSRFLESGSPQGSWWRPELLLRGSPAELRVLVDDIGDASDELIRKLRSEPAPDVPDAPAAWNLRTSKPRYLASVERLLGHIQRGDIYEVNYCTERTAMLPDFDPFAAFGRLLAFADAPFAALHRHGDRFALCMSPERFLRVEGDRVITQPMKGTRRRSADPVQDAAFVHELANDPKERSENIMAVDVARNDLSRVAASGSVTVEELCAVKSYPNVHQLVSTVQALLRDGSTPWDAVRAMFPMASMTGAPKLRALQLIDEVEDQPRGLFSGSLGYQLPDGTVDLNVVIRTITYDAATGHASLITGSAITAQSDPEQEWEECELKARSVLNALGHAG